MKFEIDIKEVAIVDQRYGLEKTFGAYEVYVAFVGESLYKHKIKDRFNPVMTFRSDDPRRLIKSIFPGIPDEMIKEGLK